MNYPAGKSKMRQILGVPRKLFTAMPELSYLGREMRTRFKPGLVPHIHPGSIMEITYIERGEVHLWAGDQVNDVPGGFVYVTWPSEVHGGVSEVSEPCKMYWMGLEVNPDGRRTSGRGSLLDLPAVEARRLAAGLLGLPRRCFPAPPALARTFDRLIDLAVDKKPDEFHQIQAHTVLVEILLAVIAYARQAAPKPQSLMVREGIRLIQEHLTKPLNLPELARKLGWNLSYFKGQFRKETGIPPAQYQLRLRIAEARRLLEKPALPVTQVAMDLGFSSCQYFSTVFKKFTGLTPQDYRKTSQNRLANRKKKVRIFGPK